MWADAGQPIRLSTYAAPFQEAAHPGQAPISAVAEWLEHNIVDEASPAGMYCSQAAHVRVFAFLHVCMGQTEKGGVKCLLMLLPLHSDRACMALAVCHWSQAVLKMHWWRSCCECTISKLCC